MKFDYIIGNPPYQDETLGDNKGFAPPIYHVFLENAYEISDVVELIHPARFLFNAGSTPKEWNNKMLHDEHLKVLYYEQDASKVFSNTDIKGGVAITYRDKKNSFGEIGTFTAYPELNSILHKVKNKTGFQSFSDIVVSRTAYRLTDKFHQDFPDAHYHENSEGNNLGRLSKGHDYDMATNIFERLPSTFLDRRPDDRHEYIQILGREGNDRVTKWVRKEYVNNPKPLHKFSIVLPKANNTGRFGETLSQPVLTEPGTGSTESFLSVGYFDTKKENENCLKYISTKFVRAMLGILKVTQDLTPDKWKYVPLQDFTNKSDIDWSKSIHDIDRQLYSKYELSDDEISFLEINVKEMN